MATRFSVKSEIWPLKVARNTPAVALTGYASAKKIGGRQLWPVFNLTFASRLNRRSY